MSLDVDAIVTGIAIGSIYGLIAIGYTVVFNATRVFNLAQGDLVMTAVMLSYLFLVKLHWSQVGAFFAVIVIVTAISLLEERVIVRPFLRRGGAGIGWFIATLAFSLIIETTVTILYGANPPRQIPSPFPLRAVDFGFVEVSPRLLAIIGTLIIVLAALQLFYRRTWTGQSMLATAQDRQAASLRGIEPNRVSVIAFALGGLTAAIAGFAIAPVVLSNPSVGLNYSIKGFVALAIGGFGSIPGAVLGGITLGVGEQLFDLHASSEYEIVAALILLVVILLTRPTGILGRTAGRQI